MSEEAQKLFERMVGRVLAYRPAKERKKQKREKAAKKKSKTTKT